MVLQLLDLAMFAVLCLCLLAGFPVAFTLAGVALVFAGLGHLAGASISFAALPSRIFGTMTNEVLVAVPLFVFMGVTLERSRVAEDLLESMAALFGRMNGGMAVAVTLVGALLAASTGIVGATVVTMGLMSLPTMLRNGYSPALACGGIAAAGTLGQIIPPSIVLVILGDQLSTAYQRAQLETGNFAPDTVSVGDLFAGALLPGLVLVGLYVAWQLIVARLNPRAMPAAAANPATTATGARQRPALATALVAPVVLIVAVLGSILAGVATPTEAAGVGVVGALLLAGARQPGAARAPVVVAAGALVALLALTALVDLRPTRAVLTRIETAAIALAALGCLAFAGGLAMVAVRLARGGLLGEVSRASARITAMVFAIVIGASVFSLVFRDLGGEALVHGLLSDLPGGTLGAIIAVMAAMFVLGFFLDFLEIVFVVVPLVAPVLLAMDMPDGSAMSPVWLAVLMAVNLQTSFLTPPFGFALFYLRGVAPDTVRTTAIYRGVVPYVAIQLMTLTLLWFAPQLATWLPAVIYR